MTGSVGETTKAEFGEADKGDRLEVPGQIVGDGFHHIRQQRDHRRRMQQRIAVRIGLRGVGDADVAAGAGLVLDDESAVQRALQHVGFIAGQKVVRCARRERHDDGHRPVRIIVGGGERRQRQSMLVSAMPSRREWKALSWCLPLSAS